MKHTKIRNILDRYSKLDYIQKCIRQINNNDFTKKVLEIGRNPMVIEIETLGPLNRDRNICLFENYDRFAGFFALFRFMLDSLYFAERFHFTPVVNYTKCMYSEDININGTSNPFEYYFNQVSNITIEEAYFSNNIIRCKPLNRDLAEQLNEGHKYRVSENYIDSMAKVAKKYIKLNSVVEPFIINDLNRILNGKKTIGVHIRGSDFNLKFNDHPVAVKPVEYISYIEKAILEYRYEQIFLATDDKSTISLFENVFGDKLVYYYDTMRTDEKISVALSNSERKNHHYLLGLEVLRDMYTLANCDGLIAGMSQVSVCARITKASYEKKYEYLEIIDKGINITNRTTKDYAKFQK